LTAPVPGRTLVRVPSPYAVPLGALVGAARVEIEAQVAEQAAAPRVQHLPGDPVL
jgi:hypothetical protein